MKIIVSLKNKYKNIIILTVIIVLILALAFCVNTCIDSKSKVEEALPSTIVAETTEQPTSSPIESFAKEHNLSISEWPNELLDLLNRNPETEEFVLNYPLKKDLKPEIDLSEYENAESVPLFMQWDERWGYAPYGDDMIAISGCGPTCLSMVSVYLLHDTTYNPKYVAEFSEENGYCIPGDGSSWTLISEGGKQLGLNVTELNLQEDIIIQNLESGNPIICIMGRGDFTDGGHYIVLTDYIDGKFKVNDPNSKIRSEKLWSFQELESQISNLWVCSV